MNLTKFNEFCEERKITPTILSEIWGISRQAVWCKKNGKYPITLDEAKKFSEYAKLTDKEKLNIFLKC